MRSAVLVVLFKRPELTRRVLQAVCAARPSLLLIAADGSRNKEESGACELCRKIVDEIDWPCEIRKNYSDVNLGCGVRMHTAITWAFEQCDELVVLEDDCLPDPSFFTFCDLMLDRYRDDARVMHISGNNFVSDVHKWPFSYYFSKYTHGSGWASWRRAWMHFDWTLRDWPRVKELGLLGSVHADPYEQRYWTKLLDGIAGGARDVWDYNWNFSCWQQSGLAILPAVNLVMNDGWGEDATHTKTPMQWPEVRAIAEIVHPPFILRNEVADAIQFGRNFGGDEMKRLDLLSVKLKQRLSILLGPARGLKRLLRSRGWI